MNNEKKKVHASTLYALVLTKGDWFQNINSINVKIIDILLCCFPTLPQKMFWILVSNGIFVNFVYLNKMQKNNDN